MNPDLPDVRRLLEPGLSIEARMYREYSMIIRTTRAWLSGAVTADQAMRHIDLIQRFEGGTESEAMPGSNGKDAGPTTTNPAV